MVLIEEFEWLLELGNRREGKRRLGFLRGYKRFFFSFVMDVFFQIYKMIGDQSDLQE